LYALIEWGVTERTHFSSVSPKGQITLPAEIRRELGLSPKDRVAITLVDGTVRVTPAVERLRRHFGSVKPLKPPRDWKDMERIAADDHADRVVAEGSPT
jgi:AbrB family looped-hinge helix DNA binding protein